MEVAALKVPLGEWMVMGKKSMAMTQEPICWRYLPYIIIHNYIYISIYKAYISKVEFISIQ